MGSFWCHCDSSGLAGPCYWNGVDTGRSLPLLEVLLSSFTYLPIFFFFHDMNSSLHYLISLLLVYLLINSFLTPNNLYTLLGVFHLEGFIGIIQSPSPPFPSLLSVLSVED